MGLKGELSSLAEVSKSPLTVVVYLAAFWNFGITPVINGTLFLLGTLVATLLLIEYKDELTTTCSLLLSASLTAYHGTVRAVKLLAVGTRRAVAFIRRRA